MSVVSGVARGGPVRRNAIPGSRAQVRRAAIVHAGIATVVAGVATVLSVVFFAIPAGWFCGVFSTVSLVLIGLSLRNLRAGRLLAARGFGFWAGIGWGLSVCAWAYLLGLTGFVPHLLLAWTLGTVFLAIVTANAVQLAVAEILATAWVVTAALFGESLLPGLIIGITGFAFPMYARPSRLVGAAMTALFTVMTTTFMTGLAANTAPVPIGVVTALATLGILRAVAARLPHDPVTGKVPYGCSGHGIAWLTNALGLVAVVLAASPVLDVFREDFAQAGRPVLILLPVGLLVAAVAAPGARRTGWTMPSVAWAIGVGALTAAIYLPNPIWATVAAGALAAGYGAARIWRHGAVPLTNKAVWLIVGTIIAASGQSVLVVAAIVTAAGAVLLVSAMRAIPGEGQVQ